jgi:hypothetical protein
MVEEEGRLGGMNAANDEAPKKDKAPAPQNGAEAQSITAGR